MSDIEHKDSDKGLKVGSQIPIEQMTDINKDSLDFTKILNDSKGILLDFFRGAF
ncbi:MAG: hypothetical protein GF311_22330 [Candidatus Lokiarchaeota archaeon]|nr:hypothetical protein [Candidatus Lokiarchaeota archaeon]